MVPSGILAHRKIGKDKLLLLERKSYKHALGFLNRSADVNRAITRLDKLGDAGERRICRVNDERERFGHGHQSVVGTFGRITMFSSESARSCRLMRGGVPR